MVARETSGASVINYIVAVMEISDVTAEAINAIER